MVSSTIPQPACHIQVSLCGIIDYTTACLSYPSIVIWYHRLYHSLLVISKHPYMVSSTIPQPACHIQASLCGIIDYTTACLSLSKYRYMVSSTIPQPACHVQASLYGIIDYTTACLSYPSILIWYHRLYHSLLVISKHRYMVSSTIPQPACHIQASLYGIIDYTTACLSYPSILIWYHQLYHSLLVISKHPYMVSLTIPQPACHIQASLYGIIDYTTACLSYPSIVIWYHRLYHSLIVISKHPYNGIINYTTACLSYPSIVIMVSSTIPQPACHIQASLCGIIDYTTACLSYQSILIWYHQLYHSLLVISKHPYMVSLTIPQPACHVQASLYGIIDYTTACLSYPSIVIWYHRLYHSLIVISKHPYNGIINYTTACLLYPSILIWYHRLYHSLLVISMHCYMVSSTIPQPDCHIQASL